MVTAVASCSSITSSWSVPKSKLADHHPLLESDREAAFATVYFLRPNTERWMGAADNILTIEADRQELLKLVKGEYIRATLKPRKTTLRIRSMSAWGPQQAIKEMEKSGEFQFQAGKTYFVLMEMVDGEFRGVFFKPQLIALTKARQLAKSLRPVGIDAKTHPIDTL